MDVLWKKKKKLPVQIVKNKKKELKCCEGSKYVLCCVCERRECVEYKVLYKMFVYNSCV